jgi:subtilisin family serine protease
MSKNGLKFNDKLVVKNNPIRYILGKLLPSVFGKPIHMRAVLRDCFGNIKQTASVYNTVTTAGKNGAMDQMLASPTLGKPTHMGIGTGTPSGTALGTELDRNALTSKTRSNAVVTMVGDWAAGDGTGSITEAGIFDASSSGNMWLSASFSVITKGASDILNITWTFTGA